MCFLLDDDEMYGEVQSCVDSKRWVWGVVLLAILSSFIAVGLSAYAIHVNHVQDSDIIDVHDEALNRVIAVEVMEQFYGITVVPGGISTINHIPASIIMPKSGPLFEKAHCVIRKNDPMASMYFMKQFEADFRGLGANVSYNYIEMRFEVPFGMVLDYRTGAGYYGFGKGANFDDDSFEPTINEGVRARCGMPFCPKVITDRDLDLAMAYPKVVGEHYVLHGALYLHNATEYAYPVTTHINCGCTDEVPPRFSCRFAAKDLLTVHERYRIDIGFEYLLKPTIRELSNP